LEKTVVQKIYCFFRWKEKTFVWTHWHN